MAIHRPESPPREGELVVPVIDEQVEVARDVVDTAEVRVRKRVTERVERVTPEITREEITVERVPVGRYVDRAPGNRMEGEVLVVPVLEEVVVVEKRLLLREELHIRKKLVAAEGTPQDVVLRREDVEVERVPFDAERPRGDG